MRARVLGLTLDREKLARSATLCLLVLIPSAAMKDGIRTGEIVGAITQDPRMGYKPLKLQ